GGFKGHRRLSNLSRPVCQPPKSRQHRRAMSDDPPFSTTSADLAAFLAGRLCHDLLSPASALASGIDLLGDPSMAGMRDETLDLIGNSARKLLDLLEFSRVAYGASASAEMFDAEKLGA